MMSAFRRCARRVLFALICSVASSAHAGFYEGVESYRNGDPQLAFQHLEPLAKLGHVQSQFLVAVMHFRGEGISKDKLLGYGWMKLAAEGGHEQAKELIPKLSAQMSEEEIRAAERSVADFTHHALNERLMPRLLASADYQSMSAPRAMKVDSPPYPPEVRRLKLSGFVIVELTIAPDGLVRDTRVVYSYAPTELVTGLVAVAPGWKFSPALKDGQPATALSTTAITYTTEGDSKRKVEKHKEEIEKKALEGDPASQYVYAAILGLKKDKRWSDALAWITQAAQAGLASAQFDVGQSLWLGRGCEQDLSKAMRWLELAAQQGDANAELLLARIALTPGTTFDADTALALLRKAADREHVHASKYFAAISAASEDERIRNPGRALELVERIAQRNQDDPTIYEIRAAAFANSGDFPGAVRAQESAISKAKMFGWDTAPMQERLVRYQAKQEWFGSLTF